MKMNIKKGDLVLVIAGKDKGKSGKVIETNPKDKKVLVEGVNIVTKHKKPKSQQDKGGIIKKPAFLDASNVQVICGQCGKATRVSHKVVDGKNVRICKKCGASLDKEFAKTVKKEAKKAEKAVKTVKKDEKTVETVKKEVSQKPEKVVAKTTKSASKTEENKTQKSASTVKKTAGATKTTQKKSKTESK